MLNGFRRTEQSESKETVVYGTGSVSRREPFPRVIIARSCLDHIPRVFQDL